MNTSIRIDRPTDGSDVMAAPTVVEGIAFSGDRGISKVEVSTDGGSTWAEARLKPPLGPYTWVLWDYTWEPKALRGKVELQARATDGDGVFQTPDERPPYPDGATGYHRVTVTVEEMPRAESS